ncbi:uncharacterized protein BX663DRAFT_73015 [Cokeromyces recurvatus]|uniref:uncharacterized protein n=1 Tax=Cokeromyces recurvatus TaxID=90255 RepID=UPI00221E3F74|nr:uncharacterized protein BX663DRAFT_73015 [Cokeromyces recurvatus]KAI7902344.1 hypothetical protein BX663DRAFT_73015 [Cokeromyces recurvatus]
MYYSPSNNNNNNTQHTDNNNTNSQFFSQTSFNPSSIEQLPTEVFNNHYYDPTTLLNEPLFNTSQWDFNNNSSQKQLDSQDAILLTDPNFLRQQQLLQDQQKEMRSRLLQHDQPEQVSNLTALLEPNDQDKASLSYPSQQKRSQNRRHQIVGKSEEADNKVDHQRRFNELQARFRINYARKSLTQQQKTNTAKTSKNTTDINENKPVATKPEPPPNTSPIASPSTPPVIIMNTNNLEEFPKEHLSSSFPSRTMPIQIKRVSRSNIMQQMDPESYQKQLDSQLDKIDFNDITVSELKELLRQRGKPATGKKAVLLQRLQEERELAKGGRSPSRVISNRHSQPLPFSRSQNELPQQQRPRSFQASSPVIIPNNSSEPVAASSVPTFLSPGSPSGQLHRSIANMHIGSPPTATRRYSPYSPRLSSSSSSSSPKINYEYSSSVPLSSSPIHHQPVINKTNNNNNNNISNSNSSSNNNSHSNNNMMLSSSYSVTRPPNRYYNNQKSYKPFTSSALATPDREEDINPFDSYYRNDPPIKEEESTDTNLNLNTINMDYWSDPAILDLILQQGMY